jgi:hypothetical protein
MKHVVKYGKRLGYSCIKQKGSNKKGGKTMEEKIKPSKVFYGISAVVLVAGIILFAVSLVTGITSAIHNINTRVVVPGVSDIELNQAGKYKIYFEKKSVLDGKVYHTDDIDGLTIRLTNSNTGNPVELNNPSVSSNYSLGGREGTCIFEFEINEPGTYLMETNYDSGTGKEAVIAIGKDFNRKLIISILLSILILFLSIPGSLVIFIITYLKRSKAIKQQSYHQRNTV